MSEQLQLSEEELRLVTELLQTEFHDLPHEIHHTRARSVRDELLRREEIVKNLLARLPTTKTSR
jgi:hypothetical protein